VRRGEKGGRGARKDKAEGEGRRRKVGKGKGGDKSPAWSSQNLGSTAIALANICRYPCGSMLMSGILTAVIEAYNVSPCVTPYRCNEHKTASVVSQL